MLGDCVSKHTFLFDLKHPGYKLQQIRVIAWKEITIDLKKSSKYIYLIVYYTLYLV